MAQLFANNAESTLAGSITDVATSLTVQTGHGAKFPSPTGGDYFLLTLTQAGQETSWEIVKCTARSGDVLTITRAQEGTTAAAWPAGSVVSLRATAGVFTGFGDVTGQSSSVDSEIALFSGAGGKTIKRATTTGILKASNGVIAPAAAGTDYVAPGGGLGTPSGGTLTNCTGLPVSTGVSGFGSNVATFLATPSSANLASAVTDETGSGALVFGTSPTITTANVNGVLTQNFSDLGNSGISTQTLNWSTYQHYKSTATGNHTVAFSNIQSSGTSAAVLFEATNYGAYTITWPAINWIKPDGTTTTSISTYLSAANRILQSTGTDLFVFWTRDGGATVYGKLV